MNFIIIHNHLICPINNHSIHYNNFNNNNLEKPKQQMNNQQVDHVLTFYRINFDFHDPYKFLLDGNFIKLMI